MATQYVTIEEFHELSIAASAVSNLTAAEKNKILLSESSRADGYLADQFKLPLVSWDEDLKQAVADRAALRMLRKRGFNPERGVDADVLAAAKEALAWLEGVSAGKIIPQVVDSSPIAEPGQSSISGGMISSASQRGYSRRGTTEDDSGFQGD